jgi:hypothetical protein
MTPLVILSTVTPYIVKGLWIAVLTVNLVNAIKKGRPQK